MKVESEMETLRQEPQDEGKVGRRTIWTEEIVYANIP
jgi:hypothetical protein